MKGKGCKDQGFSEEAKRDVCERNVWYNLDKSEADLACCATASLLTH